MEAGSTYGSLLTWIPRHSEELLTSFRVCSDGRTAIHRTVGQRWPSGSISGERILVKVASATLGRRAGLGPTMVLAIYVGHHGRSGALLALCWWHMMCTLRWYPTLCQRCLVTHHPEMRCALEAGRRCAWGRGCWGLSLSRSMCDVSNSPPVQIRTEEAHLTHTMRSCSQPRAPERPNQQPWCLGEKFVTHDFCHRVDGNPYFVFNTCPWLRSPTCRAELLSLAVWEKACS